MNDHRAAAIFPDDLETLEAAGELLFRYHENTAGIRLLAIALRLRGQTGIRQAQLSERGGVEQLERHGLADSTSYESPRSLSFACDVDESAGLAEIVELNGYSRKVLPGCGA